MIDIPRIQQRLLDMAVTIAAILDQEKIPHRIAFGTLLGAVRHGGFIPWDDDFDFFLFSDSYDQALAALRKNLPADMFLEDPASEPNYFHAWAHVKDTKSICRCEHYPHDALYTHQGISVDLYKMTEMPLCEVAEFRYQEAMAYIKRRRELGFITPEDYARRAEKYAGQRLVEQNTDHSKVMAYPFDVGYQFYDNIFPLKKYKFAGYEFWGPNNAAAVLTRRYGDYMTLPPVEQRIPHFSQVTFL